MNIAIIPARGGSKRIPRKNIKLFHGKPMIAYSIEAARKSKCFDKIIVSTDDQEIAEVAKKYGAEVPFIRPSLLSDDHTGTNDVIVHAIEFLKHSGIVLEYIACIYATAPFLTYQIIQKGMNLLEQHKDADYSVTVAKYPFPVQRALKLQQNGRLTLNDPEYAMARSQDLDEYCHDAGQLYCGRAESFKLKPTVFLGSVLPVYLDSKSIQDIDTPEDWDRAELLFEALYRGIK